MREWLRKADDRPALDCETDNLALDFLILFRVGLNRIPVASES